MPAKLIEFNNVSKQYIMGEVKIDALKMSVLPLTKVNLPLSLVPAAREKLPC